MIPGNKGKSNKQLGMAMRGTGGSGKLSALDIVVNTLHRANFFSDKNACLPNFSQYIHIHMKIKKKNYYSFQTKKDEISLL